MIKTPNFLRVIFIITAFMVSVAGLRARSAPPVIDAVFHPDSVAIGDHFLLEVTVNRDIMQVVEFPVFDNDMLGDMIEILHETGQDTIAVEGRRITLRKEYLLTTFEDGELRMGKFPALYLDKNIVDTIFSRNDLIIKVGTFEIDTLTQNIYDIKPVADAPVRFVEFGGYLICSIVLSAIIVTLIVYLIRRRRNREETIRTISLPPHVRAIEALEDLHNKKLWQNSRHKAYYSELSDILREYIEGRYGIGAMELTTDETLSAIRDMSLPDDSMAALAEILKTADLVKFAKYIPDPETNENLYSASYYFIENTKLHQIEPEAQIEI